VCSVRSIPTRKKFVMIQDYRSFQPANCLRQGSFSSNPEQVFRCSNQSLRACARTICLFLFFCAALFANDAALAVTSASGSSTSGSDPWIATVSNWQDAESGGAQDGQQEDRVAAGDGQGAGTTSGKDQGVSGPTWVEVVFSGGPLGTMIILGLVGLSVCAVYLVIDQVIALRRKELMPEGLADQVRDCLLKGQVDQAVEECQAKPSSLSFVLLHGIEEIPFGWSSVEKATEDALAEQSARLYRKTEYLSVIGNIDPMVGLLGTVLGMILAFHRVATSQGTAAAPELAEGIYQALITTVGGLLVAIPSLGAFAILRNRLDQLIAETAHLTQTVFSSLRTKRKSKTSAS